MGTNNSLFRWALAFLFIIVTPNAFAQWPLTDINRSYYQWSHNTQNLLSKVKYTTKKYRVALFNLTHFNTSLSPRLHGMLPEQQSQNSQQAMMIMRDSSGQTGSYDEMFYLSGSSSNYARDLETDALDRFVVLADNLGDGWTFNNPVNSISSAKRQLLLFKVDLQMQLVWQKIYGGSNHENAIAIRKAGDGNMLVLAETQSHDGDVQNFNGGKDIWLLKINQENGNLIWQKTYGSPANEIPTDLEVLEDGSIMISGMADPGSFAPSVFTDPNAFLMKLDDAGNLIWNKVYGGSDTDMIRSFIPVNDGGFVSIANSNSNDGIFAGNAGGFDVYINRHNSDGNIVWSKRYGNSQNDDAGDIVYTSCDSMIFAGYAKEFSYDTYFGSSFPVWSQRAGVKVGIYLNGIEFFYQENNFNYPLSDNSFNQEIHTTFAPNNRGGFLSGNLKHNRWSSNRVTRSFDMHEYGVKLRQEVIDTSLCFGAALNGTAFFADSSFSDTLRNNCNIDTLIRNITVQVTDVTDSFIQENETICYGSIYEGELVYNSFIINDTSYVSTSCGQKRIIKEKNITVRPPLLLDLGNDGIICKEGRMLSAAAPGYSYAWHDGSSGSTFYAQSNGIFWVEVTDLNGCKKRDSITLTLTDLFLSAPNDTIINPGDQVTLVTTSNGILSWTFQPSLSCTACPSPVAGPLNNTWYVVQSSKDGCLVIDSVLVEVDGGYFVWIPTAFSPNGDGKNDVFRVSAHMISNYSLEIFNRWGELVFKTNEIQRGWDGRFRNKYQPTGSFVYQVRFKDPAGNLVLKKGHFMLVR